MKRIFIVMVMMVMVIGFSFPQEMSEDEKIEMIEQLNAMTSEYKNVTLGDWFLTTTDMEKEFFVFGYALALIEAQEQVEDMDFLSEEDMWKVREHIKWSRVSSYFLRPTLDEYRKSDSDWKNTTIKSVLKDYVWVKE